MATLNTPILRMKPILESLSRKAASVIVAVLTRTAVCRIVEVP
jgi:hypothetical protein